MSRSDARDVSVDDYITRLDAAVGTALAARNGDLRTFLASLTGADPVFAIEALRRHVDGEHGPRASALLGEAARPVAVAASELPIVHPLDFAWLFTPETQTQLIDQAGNATRRGDLVVYLGCPTLHRRALYELPDRRHLLLDRDTRRVQQANERAADSARRVDLLVDALARLDATLVVADPPWYPAAAAAFANAAAIVMRPGATLLLAFADPLTRPGAEHDLDSILLSAREDGLDFIEVSAGACRYEMPPYERAAFTAAGLPGIPTDWRLGGLTTLRRSANSTPRRRRVQEPKWLAREIDGIPLRLRADAPASGYTLLETLVHGAILPSVSRRDPRRARVAMWTSQNRVYASCDPPTLAHALSHSPAGDSLSELREEITRIVALERGEHGLPTMGPQSRDRAA